MTQLWVPTKILETIKTNPVMVYLLLLHLMEQYAIEITGEVDGINQERLDQMIDGMLTELQNQMPIVQQIPVKADEIN